MTLLELLADCSRRGIVLSADGDRLRVKSPRKIDPDLHAALQRHKAELLDRLRRTGENVVPLSLAQHGAESHPLSIAQQSLWFVHRLDAATLPAYNIRKAFVLDGPLDIPRWIDAFSKVVRRHASLRSSFETDGEMPVARIHAVDVPVEIVDLGTLTEAEQDAEIRRRLDEEGRYAFELSRPPLVRAFLLRLSAERSVFVLNAHHLVADAWSAGVVLREMRDVYGGHPLTPDAPSYDAYVEWQRRRIESGALEPHIEYWKKQLAELPPLQIATDCSALCHSERSEEPGRVGQGASRELQSAHHTPSQVPRYARNDNAYDGASEAYELPRDLADRMRSFAGAHGVTLYSAFLASFAALLHRYSGQDDFPIGASIAGRTRSEFEEVVGLFADVAVLRMDVGGAPTFAELAARAQRTSAEAFEHQEVPFDLVVKALRPERVRGQNPLFQVLFLFLQGEAGEMQLPSVTSKFDLSLHVEDTGTGIRGLIEYKTALFEARTIRQLLSSWLELLQSAVEEPSRPVASLPIVTADMRQELLFARNQLRRAELPYETIPEWFEAQVRRTPDRVAVNDGEIALSYRELDERADRIAAALRARGVGPEVRVGLLLPRSADLVIAILGVLKAGGAYVPFDPADPAPRLDFMRENSGVAMVIDDVEALLHEPVDAPSSAFGTFSPVSSHGGEGSRIFDSQEAMIESLLPRVSGGEGGRRPDEGGVAIAQSEKVRRANAAYVIYTSGSTGQPRGVVVTHENVLRLMVSTQPWFGFDENDVWTLFHSYAFDFSVWEIWGALLYGGRVAVVPYAVSRSPEEFHDFLTRERVTVLNQTPSAFRQLIAFEESAGGSRQPAVALRYVIFGGEALDLAMLAPWIARHGDDSPQLINMYGITETTVHVTWRRVTAADVAANRGSVIGNRIPDLTLTILDEDLEPVPEGVAGQLHVGGAGLSRGYLGRPGLTAEKFIPDPFSVVPGARLYRTGDVARWRGGDIEYLGRADDQVKIRGFRIEPGEIESVLRAHSAVKECTVIARSDGGQKRLIAYYIPASSGDSSPAAEERSEAVGQEWPTAADRSVRSPVDPAELRAFCEERLPSHMVPAAYVAVAAWPRTRNDKLDRAKLPMPELENATVKLAYEAPRNEAERMVASIWERVLGAGRVGIHDDFFALGGDSILSLEVLSQMRKHGLESSVAQLYQHHTVADLAAVAGRAAVAANGPERFALIREYDRPKLPQHLEDAYPLSQLQAGMLYEEQLHPDAAVYHDIFSFHLKLPFDQQTWTAVLQDCVDRNPTLRTSFDLTHFSEPLQLVHEHAAANISFADFSGLPEDEQERRIRGIVDAERAHRYDYTAPPLLRFYVVKRSEERSQVIFGFHHAILDGWSVAVMFSRLLAATIAEQKGAPLPSELPRVRYASFVEAERKALASDEAFWREEVAKLPFAQLPRREDAPAGTHTIKTLSVEIPQEVADGVVRTARETGVPLKTALLAAHLRVLGAMTGQAAAVTGLVTNGRPEEAGAERVLGLFLNTLPLHVDLATGTFAELIRRTFEAEQRLLAHRRFPMAAAKRLAGGRTLFDAAFNFVHFHVYQEVMQTAGLEVLEHQVWEETDFPFLAQFSVYPGSSRIELALIHDAAQFDDEQMKRIATAYARCLRAIAGNAQSNVREHSLVSDEERARIEEWGRVGGHAGAAGETRALHRWFEEQARRTPDAIALRCEGEQLTYRDLDERANRLANHLRSVGVERETLVGLCLDRSLDLVVSIVAILKAGGAYVPLDPSYPASRLQFIVEDSRVAVVVSRVGQAFQPVLLPTKIEGQAGKPVLHEVLLDRDAAAIAAQPALAPEVDSQSSDAAYVIYTSGSTGKPKGVVVTHENVARLMSATEPLFGFGASDVWTLFHSYAFDFSVWEIWGALLYGGRVVVVPYSVSRSPEEFYELLLREGVTVLNQTPTAFYQLMEVDERPSAVGSGQPAVKLRYVIFGGEALDLTRLKTWFDRHGDASPQLVNMYGITETTVHVTHRPLRAEDAAKPRSVIGRPLPHLEALVLDPAGERVPVGVAGELYVGGGGVARGYLRRDDLTAARFVTRIANAALAREVTRSPGHQVTGSHPPGDPVTRQPGDPRLYRTGDLARWLPTGELEYLGRIDTQVKVRGFRIELGEIEHALRADERVRDAAVVLRDGRLVAYVVAQSSVTPADLRRRCEEQLPDYMVPAAYVAIDAIPLTANGKLDRDALPDAIADALPAIAYVAPSNDVERQICSMCEQILGVDNVGIRHSFFDLGGHSLHATQLIARVREAFAVDLPLRTLFEQPTPEKLAAAVAAQRGRDLPRAGSGPTRSKRRQIQLSDLAGNDPP